MTEEQFKKGRSLLSELNSFVKYRDDLITILSYDSFEITPSGSSFTYLIAKKEDIKPIIEKEIEKTKKTIKELEEEFKKL